MTCANHPDRQNTAFCQHCGKPLCPECTRTAGTAVFCEPCLAARLGTNPQPGAPGSVYPPPVASIPGEPSPTLAAILGFIPGVGAMYNGQYAKGVVHLVVFAILASLAHDFNVFGLFVAGWVFYQVFEAHHTARARRDGTPLPNPFGLNDLGERMGFGNAWPSAAPPSGPQNGTQTSAPPPPSSGTPPAGTPPYSYEYNYSYQYPPVPPPPPLPTDEEMADWHRNRFPAGAFWLIALGVVFLLGNLHIFPHYSAAKLFPLLLIGFGVWTFVRRMSGPALPGEDADPTLHRLRTLHAFHSGFWLVLVGVLWLLNSWSILRWRFSWPFFLIAGGVALLVRRAALFGMPMPTAPPPPASAAPGTAIVPTPYQPDSSDPDETR